MGRSHDDGHHGLEPNDGPSRNAATQRRPLKTESVNQQISKSERGLGGVHERIIIKIRYNLYDELIIRLEANQVV